MKKTLRTTAIALLAACTWATTAQTARANDFAGGDGTANNPYLISDIATLEHFRNYINAGNGQGEHFALTTNIDLSATYNEATATSWEPIGNYNDDEENDIALKAHLTETATK